MVYNNENHIIEMQLWEFEALYVESVVRSNYLNLLLHISISRSISSIKIQVIENSSVIIETGIWGYKKWIILTAFYLKEL